MQLSSRISPMWLVVLILGMTGVSCATRKSTVFSSGELPPPVTLSQLDTITSKESTSTKLQVSYARLPLSFEANYGQTDEQVHFLSRGHGYTLFLTSTEAILQLRNADFRSRNVLTSPSSDNPQSALTNPQSAVVHLQLVGANPNPQVAGLEELPGKVNYFRGNDQQKWQTNIPTYAKVRYQDVYPGVDLAYYGNQRQLEYDFIVTPGADPAAIRLGFAGLVGAPHVVPEIDANGDLLLRTAGGEIRMHKPLIYQEIDGVKNPIPGGYVLLSAQSSPLITFQVAAYDTSKPLIIDPVLSYSTYLGGSGEDIGRSIAVDSSGYAYVAGYTASVNFPTANPFRAISHGGYDAFVTKLNATGTALVYSTYLGGTGDDYGHGLTVDSSGSVYVTGATRSTDFPTQNPLQAFGGCAGSLYGGSGCDGFVTKIDPAGSALIYSTYLGGSGADTAFGIAIDSSGNAYITGGGSADGFPPAPVTFLPASAGIFVVKLNAAGSALLYKDFLGAEAGYAIAVDSSGSAYITGNSHPTVQNIQPTPGAFQQNYGGAFVIKVKPDGSDLVYSSYLGGGNGDEGGFGIDVDFTGNAYVTGLTQSSNFPTTPGVFQTTKNAIRTAFVTKVNPTGTAMVYSTYLGGTSQPPAAGDYGLAIAVDSAGNAYVTGQATSSDFPLVTPFQASYGGGYSDAYITKLNSTGTALIYSTYFGGSGEDTGFGIALDSSSNAYVTGFTASTNFPTKNPLQPANGGGSDAFVAKLSENQAPVADPGTDHPVNEGAPVTLDGSGSSDPNGDSLTYHWVQIAGPPVQLNLSDPVHPSFTAPDVAVGGATCSFQLVVSDGKVQSEPVVVNITIKHVNHAPVACVCPAEQHVQEGSLVLLDGAKSYDPDSDSLTFKWTQTAGPRVVLADPTAAQTSFTAPLTGRAGATLTFVLTVSDGTAQGTATATVVVEYSNHVPTANAGDDQTKNEGSSVALDGTHSDDPDQDTLTYTWTQISGPGIILSNSHSPTPTFAAPLVGHGGATLVFRLVVNDGLVNSAPDTVTITVLDINDPPACALAQVSPDLLWPPNHKLLPLGIVGVADPNDDTVTIAVTGVTQDEPVNGLGDGDTSPDAVIQGGEVLLRAERTGTGNGRVYKVSFTADDGFGGRCTGSVKVCVPHDRQSNVCVDDGQRYNSTRP